MGKRWLPLEANPEVIEKYIKNLKGPSNIGFVDVLTCDEAELDLIPKPVYGLLLLFPINAKTEEAAAQQDAKIKSKGQVVSDNVWFTRQTVGNACGTISLLHLVANINDKAPYACGGFFDRFFKETKLMTPDERAKALEEDKEIEDAHAHAEQEGQSKVPTIDQKIDTHFVVMVEVDGILYELDGRKMTPINHGPTTQDSFLRDSVRVAKTEFMDRDPDEVLFSMIAVTARMIDG